MRRLQARKLHLVLLERPPPFPPAFKGKARSLVLTDSRWAGCSTKVFSVFGTGLTERAP